MRQLVYTSILLIINLRFTCGERKICSTIKKTQNIIIDRSKKNYKYSIGYLDEYKIKPFTINLPKTSAYHFNGLQNKKVESNFFKI